MGINIFLLIINAVLFFNPEGNGLRLQTNSCDVSEFYETVDPGSGAKVLTRMGDLQSIELVLVPTSISTGNYKVNISRKGSDVYKLEGTDYYLETRYCYEYATFSSARFEVTSNYGYTKGKVYFD